MKKKPQDPRRLLVLFVLTTLVPAASLAWVGWRMVEEDRLIEDKRSRQDREQSADLAASALQRVLAEAEERLTTFSTSTGSVPVVKEGETLAILTHAGLSARAGVTLPYYPAIAVQTVTPDRLLAADELELRKRDLPGALRLLTELTRSQDSSLRAPATLRIARIHRKAGSTEEALVAYAALISLDPAQAEGLPAGLSGLQGRALIYKAAGRAGDVEREDWSLSQSCERPVGTYSRPVFVRF